MSCAMTAGTASRTISGKIRPWSKRSVADMLLRFIDNEESLLLLPCGKAFGMKTRSRSKIEILL